MTTLTAVDRQRDESRVSAVARRLRGELAQQSVSGSEAARRCGLTQPAMSRRLRGAHPFDIAELDHVCQTLGIDFDYVTTGIRALPEPDGDSKLPRLDSNQEPFDLQKFAA